MYFSEYCEINFFLDVDSAEMTNFQFPAVILV